MSATRSSGPDDERVAVHQRPARRREGDHARGHVAVERRGDDGGAATRARASRMSLLRGAAVRDHEQPDPDLDRDPLRLGPVADHDDVARLRSRAAASRSPSPGPTRGRRPPCRAPPRAARPPARPRSRRPPSGRRGATPRATRARSAGPARARSSRRRAARPSSTTGTRSTSSRAMMRPTWRTGSRSSASGKRVRITSRTRSSTCGSSSGTGAPLRSSTQRVCALSSPSRTGT